MRRLAILAVTLTTVATVLMASRCSDDDDPVHPVAAQEAEPPVATGDANAARDEHVGRHEEKDPIGDPADAPGAELMPPPPPDDGGSGEAAMDEQSFEPTPPTEGAADTATGP